MKTLYAVLLSISVSSAAIASTCPLQEIRNDGDHLNFNGFSLKLQDLDGPGDPSSPPSWPDGMVVSHAGGGQCSVNIGIIDPPFFLAGTHMLYVDTYNGSEHTQVAVNVENCKIAWSSDLYVGVPQIKTGNMIVYHGIKSIHVGDDCLPLVK